MNACLIGFNLTNFLLAILLSKKGFKVDIIFEEKNTYKFTNRTIGVSKKNVEFIKSFLQIPNQYLWPIKEIEIFNLNNNPSKKIKFKDNKNENFFIIKQDYFSNLSERKCRKLKNVYFKKYKENEILKLEKKNNYNLIINSQSNNILVMLADIVNPLDLLSSINFSSIPYDIDIDLIFLSIINSSI